MRIALAIAIAGAALAAGSLRAATPPVLSTATQADPRGDALGGGPDLVGITATRYKGGLIRVRLATAGRNLASDEQLSIYFDVNHDYRDDLLVSLTPGEKLPALYRNAGGGWQLVEQLPNAAYANVAFTVSFLESRLHAAGLPLADVVRIHGGSWKDGVASDETPDVRLELSAPPSSPPPPPAHPAQGGAGTSAQRAPLTIAATFFYGTWVESRLRGPFVVVGIARRRVPLAVTLRSGARTVRLRAEVGPGDFRKWFALPPDLLPGRYVVTIAVPSAPKLSPRPRVAVLRPPAEGIVSRAFTSAGPSGSPRAKFPPTTSVIYARFFFVPSALPAPGHTLRIQWINAKAQTLGAPRVEPRARAVVASIGLAGGLPLRPGTYTCVLRAGTVVVKSVTATVG